MKSTTIFFLLVLSLLISSCGNHRFKVRTAGVSTSPEIQLALQDQTFLNGVQTVTVVAKDQKGNPIANEEVSLKIGEETHKKTTDSNGEAKFEIEVGYSTLEQEITISSKNSAPDKTTSAVVKSDFVPASSYSVPQKLDTAGYSQEVLSGDLNKDGILDLVSGFNGNQISVYLGLGNGTFSAPLLVGLSETIDALEAEIIDLDGDGHLDVVAPGTSKVHFLKGDGTGTLVATEIGLTHSAPSYTVRVKDLNKDGKLDIVVGQRSGGILIFYGQGNLQFSSPTTLSSYPWIRSIDFGDLNGDGNLDLVATCFRMVDGGQIGGMEYFLGRSDGGYEATVQFPYSTTDEKGQFIRIADLNGDKKPDVIASTYFGRNFKMLLSKPDNTFEQVEYYLGRTTVGFALVDFDRDGDLDIVVNDLWESYVHIIKNDGLAQFSVHQTLPTSSKPSWGVTVGDFNLDGIPDIATGHHLSNSLSILIGEI